MNVQELAREGTNTQCVECNNTPLFGGVRCIRCFQARVEKRREQLLAGEGGQPGQYKKVTQHTCVKHEPAVVCYIKCKCRCIDCLQVMTAYRKKNAR